MCILPTLAPTSATLYGKYTVIHSANHSCAASCRFLSSQVVVHKPLFDAVRTSIWNHKPEVYSVCCLYRSSARFWLSLASFAAIEILLTYKSLRHTGCLEKVWTACHSFYIVLLVPLPERHGENERPCSLVCNQWYFIYVYWPFNFVTCGCREAMASAFMLDLWMSANRCFSLPFHLNSGCQVWKLIFESKQNGG